MSRHARFGLYLSLIGVAAGAAIAVGREPITATYVMSACVLAALVEFVFAFAQSNTALGHPGASTAVAMAGGAAVAGIVAKLPHLIAGYLMLDSLKDYSKPLHLKCASAKRLRKEAHLSARQLRAMAWRRRHAHVEQDFGLPAYGVPLDVWRQRYDKWAKEKRALHLTHLREFEAECGPRARCL